MVYIHENSFVKSLEHDKPSKKILGSKTQVCLVKKLYQCKNCGKAKSRINMKELHSQNNSLERETLNDVSNTYSRDCSPVHSSETLNGQLYTSDHLNEEILCQCGSSESCDSPKKLKYRNCDIISDDQSQKSKLNESVHKVMTKCVVNCNSNVLQSPEGKRLRTEVIEGWKEAKRPREDENISEILGSSEKQVQ